MQFPMTFSAVTRLMDRNLIGLYHLLKGHHWLQYTPFQAWGNYVKLRNAIQTRGKLVMEEELRGKYREALTYLADKYGPESLGDYLEFGVYNDTSLIQMYRVLEELGLGHVRLLGFDSFEGLPVEASDDDDGHWRPGSFKSEHEFTMQVLRWEKINLQRVSLTKGFFESTLTAERRAEQRITKASVIMIDCDMYLSAKTALEFSAPLIVDEAVIVFDDWFPLADRNLGEKRAFDEFLQAHHYFEVKEFGTYPPYGKIFVLVRSPAVLNHNLIAPSASLTTTCSVV